MSHGLRASLCLAAGITLSLIPSCDAHGTKLTFNAGELYYTSAVSKAQAEKLGNYFVEQGIFDGERKSVQLDKTGDTFEVRLVVIEGYDEEAEFVNLCRKMGQEISQGIFDGAKVVIHMCDDQLRTLRVVAPVGQPQGPAF